MADVESNINININTSGALANLKNLQREISAFHTNMAKGGAAANATSAQMQQNLINTINASGKFAAQMKTISSTAETFTNSLEKNKLSMGEYFRYAGASTKTFGKLFRSEFDTIEKVARERVKTLQTQYIKMGRDANGAMKSIAVRPLVLDMNDLGTKTAMAAQKQQLFNQLVKQGSTNLLNFGKNTQWAGRQLMVGFSIPLGIAGAAAAREFMKIEEQAIRFKRVYGDAMTPTAEADKMAEQIKMLAGEFTQYGVAVADTIKLAADAAAMGKQGVDLLAQVGQANRLSVLGGVDQQQALETTTSLTNAFGVAAEDLAGKIDFLNAVENQTVTSIDDLTTAIPTAAPVIKQLGGNVQDLAFFLTAMREGGIDASEGANALKSGLASIINPSKEATDMLNGFGINLKGIVDQDKGNVKQMVVDLAGALNDLDPLNRAQAIETLFGKFQFARMSTLFQNVVAEGSQATRVLDLTKKSATELAVLSERELKRVSDSPMFKFQKALEDFQAAMAPVGEAFIKMITPIVEFGKQLLDGFNGWNEGAKNFTMILVGVVAGIGPIFLMVFGLIANGVANLMKGFLGLSNFFKRLGGQTTTLGSQTDYMTQQQLEAAAVAASLEQAHSRLTQEFTSEASAVAALTAAYERAVAAQARFGGVGVGTKGKPKKMATGGVVMVPGSGKGDKVPAMLEPGEAVIPGAMAKKYAPLISGMIAGNIPGYASGNQETHAAGSMPKTPGVLAQVDVRYPGFSQISAELLHAVEILSDLTTTKSTTLNQAAKGSGMSADAFQAEWSKNPEGFVATSQRAAAAAGETLSEADIKEIVGIDKNVGDRVTQRIRSIPQDANLKPGWLDDIIAEETANVIDEGLQSTDPVKKKAAERLQSRKDTVGTIRTRKVGKLIDPETGQPYGSDSAYFDKQRQRGNLKSRPGQVGLYADGTDFQFSRTAYSSDRETRKEEQQRALEERKQNKETSFRQRTNSATIGAFGSVTPGGTYEKPLTAGTWAGTQSINDFIRGLEIAAETASPSKRTRKVAKDTVDGYVEGLKEGEKEAAKQASKTAKASVPKTNTNPAFGAVPAQPRVVSPAMQEYLRGRVGKMMPGGAMSASQIVAANIPKLSGNFSILDTNIKNMSRQIQLARSPITLLTSAASAVGGSLTKATTSVKQFAMGTPAMLKEASTKFSTSIKQIGIAAKDAAVSIGNSARQIAASTGSAIGGGLKGMGGKLKASMSGGGGMAAGMMGSMALGAMSGMEGPAGDVAGALTPIATGASMGMMFGPYGAAAGAALGALTSVVIASKDAFEGAQRAVEKFASAAGPSTQAIEALAQASGNVSAGENMDKRRSNAQQYARSEQTNGVSQAYLESDAGKASMEAVGTTLSTGNSAQAVSSISAQMATAIASGAISRVDARAIVEDMGAQLGDQTFALKANAQIDSLVGPNGEDLAKDPIGVRLKILDEGKNKVATSAKEVGGFVEDMGEIFNENLFNFSTPLATLNSIGNMVNPAMMLTNTIIGGVQQMAELGTETAAFASNLVLSTQQTQEMLDSLQLDYEKRIEIAKAAGDTAEAMRLQKEYEDGRAKILQQNAQMYKDAGTAYAGMDSNAKTGVIGSLDQQIKDKYKEGPMKAIAEKSISDIGSMTEDGSTAELTLKTAVASGDLDPTTMNSVLGLIKSGGGKVEVAADLITNLGTADADRVMQFATFAETPEKAVTFMTTFQDMDPAASAKLLNTLDVVGKTAGQTAVEVLVSGDPKKLETLTADLEDLDAQFQDGKPKTYTTKMKFGSTGFNLTKSQAAYFNGLAASDQKTYVTAYLTTKETIDLNTAEGKARVAEYRKTNKISKSVSNSDVVDMMSADAAKTQVETSQAQAGPTPPPDTSDNNTDGGGGGGSQDTSSSIDDITKRMKQFQNAAMGVGKSWEESMSIIQSQNGGFLASFNGMEQQLRRLGARNDMISVITGMSAEEYEKRKNDLFVFDDAGNIVGVTDQFNALRNAMNSVAMGEFQNKQKATTQTIGDQFTAVKKLVAAGVSLSDAYKIVEDTAVASAIAQTDNAAATREVAAAAREAEQATKNLAAAQAVSAKNQAVVDRAALIKKLQSDKKLNDDQIAAILADDNLARLYLNPTVDPATLQTALQNAANQTTIKFTEQMLTVDGMEQAFSDGMGKAMEAFSAQEQVIKVQFDAQRDPFQDIVEGGKNFIEDLQNAPGGLDDLNADLERIAAKEQEINDRYQDKYEALDKVSKINDKLIAQQRSQLTLADALSKGDIAAAAAAAQEMRAKQTSDALSEQRQILDANKKFELSSLTGNSGLTREQIEAQVRDLKAQILEIEENTIEPAQRQIELLDRQQKALIDSLTVMGHTKDYWDGIKAQTELAKVNTQEYATAINNAYEAMVKLNSEYAKTASPVVTAPSAAGHSIGGMIRGYASGGLASIFKSMGSDTIPAMLTPGEFVIKKPAVDKLGLSKLQALNNGKSYGDGSVYNYSVSVNVATGSNPEEIAQSVIRKIKSIDDQRIRSNRF
jgi:TP901 family phage tail tape measure protein